MNFVDVWLMIVSKLIEDMNIRWLSCVCMSVSTLYVRICSARSIHTHIQQVERERDVKRREEILCNQEVHQGDDQVSLSNSVRARLSVSLVVCVCLHASGFHYLGAHRSLTLLLLFSFSLSLFGNVTRQKRMLCVTSTQVVIIKVHTRDGLVLFAANRNCNA